MSSYPAYVIHGRGSTTLSSSTAPGSPTSPSFSQPRRDDSGHVSPRTGRVIYGPPSRAIGSPSSQRIPSRSMTMPEYSSLTDRANISTHQHATSARPPPLRSSTTADGWPRPPAPHRTPGIPGSASIHVDRRPHRAQSALSMSSVSTDATLVSPSSSFHDRRHEAANFKDRSHEPGYADTADTAPVSLAVEKRTTAQRAAADCAWAITWPVGRGHRVLRLHCQTVGGFEFDAIPGPVTHDCDEPIHGAKSGVSLRDMHHFSLGSLDRRGRRTLEAIARSLLGGMHMLTDQISWVNWVLDQAVQSGLLDRATVNFAMMHGRGTLD